MINKTLFICILSVGFTFVTGGVFAYVASSTNYRLQSDSINFGGGLSTSSSYLIEDTIGEIGTGNSSSTSYNLHAGYQQMDSEVYIAVSTTGNVTLTPTLNALAGGQANGGTDVTVTTDNPAGYTLTAQASGNPAFTSSQDSMLNYTPSAAVPDFSWGITSIISRFGFSVEGNDTAQRFLDNGAVCGSGSGNVSDSCWDGVTPSPVTVATRSNGNHPSGTATRLKFRAEIGQDKVQKPGSYSASITVTATTQ